MKDLFSYLLGKKFCSQKGEREEEEEKQRRKEGRKGGREGGGREREKREKGRKKRNEKKRNNCHTKTFSLHYSFEEKYTHISETS